MRSLSFFPSHIYRFLTGHEAYANVKSDFRDTKCILLALRFSDCLEQIIHDCMKAKRTIWKADWQCTYSPMPTWLCVQRLTSFLERVELQVNIVWRGHSIKLWADPIISCSGFMAQNTYDLEVWGNLSSNHWYYFGISARQVVLTQSLKHPYREYRQNTANKTTERVSTWKMFFKIKTREI